MVLFDLSLDLCDIITYMPQVQPNNPSDSPKQRKDPRARIDLSINMLFVDGKSYGALSGAEHFRRYCADIKDLSSTSMMIKACGFNPQLEASLLSGEIMVSLQFSLPAYHNPINVIAQVTRIKKQPTDVAVFYNIGVKFVRINPLDQAAIDKYIRTYGKKDI